MERYDDRSTDASVGSEINGLFRISTVTDERFSKNDTSSTLFHLTRLAGRIEPSIYFYGNNDSLSFRRKKSDHKKTILPRLRCFGQPISSSLN